MDTPMRAFRRDGRGDVVKRERGTASALPIQIVSQYQNSTTACQSVFASILAPIEHSGVQS